LSTLRIYIDFKSGPAYLAMKPTLALLERHGVRAEWLPFDTRQAPIPPARAGESRGETHIRVRQEQRRRTCLKYAAIQGIPMVYPAEPGHTRCALAALLHVSGDPLPFIAAAYAAYWRDGLDLDNAGVVSRLLSEWGCDTASFDPADYNGLLECKQIEAEELGVFDTPMYVLGGELFLGREQLPLIETLLANL
jgi:2-hydroxychromene-2-carboxylate isomerase